LGCLDVGKSVMLKLKKEENIMITGNYGPSPSSSYPRGTRGSSLGLKRTERETDHSPPSAEVK